MKPTNEQIDQAEAIVDRWQRRNWHTWEIKEGLAQALADAEERGIRKAANYVKSGYWTISGEDLASEIEALLEGGAE